MMFCLRVYFLIKDVKHRHIFKEVLYYNPGVDIYVVIELFLWIQGKYIRNKIFHID